MKGECAHCGCDLSLFGVKGARLCKWCLETRRVDRAHRSYRKHGARCGNCEHGSRDWMGGKVVCVKGRHKGHVRSAAQRCGSWELVKKGKRHESLGGADRGEVLRSNPDQG